MRLTTGEFDLLAAFVNNANQVLSRDRLLDLARNREAGPFDRTIDVQVGRLRRKLEDDPQNPTHDQDGARQRLYLHADRRDELSLSAAAVSRRCSCNSPIFRCLWLA